MGVDEPHAQAATCRAGTARCGPRVASAARAACAAPIIAHRTKTRAHTHTHWAESLLAKRTNDATTGRAVPYCGRSDGAWRPRRQTPPPAHAIGGSLKRKPPSRAARFKGEGCAGPADFPPIARGGRGQLAIDARWVPEGRAATAGHLGVAESPYVLRAPHRLRSRIGLTRCRHRACDVQEQTTTWCSRCFTSTRNNNCGPLMHVRSRPQVPRCWAPLITLLKWPSL